MMMNLLFSVASNGLGEHRTRDLSFAGSNFHHSPITAPSCQMQNALGNATPVFSPNSVTRWTVCFVLNLFWVHYRAFSLVRSACLGLFFMCYEYFLVFSSLFCFVLLRVISEWAQSVSWPDIVKEVKPDSMRHAVWQQSLGLSSVLS